MIIKRPAGDLTFVHELRYGDLVKRLFGQQFQECVLDGGFGQNVPSGIHLSWSCGAVVYAACLRCILAEGT